VREDKTRNSGRPEVPIPPPPLIRTRPQGKPRAGWWSMTVTAALFPPPHGSRRAPYRSLNGLIREERTVSGLQPTNCRNKLPRMGYILSMALLDPRR
jgi:hypothetical protein